MRAQRFSVFALCFFVVWLLPHGSEAQSNKYKRKQSATPVAPATAGVEAAKAPTSANAVAQPTTPAADTSGKAAPANPEKVDISDLEQRYWAPKDTEFSVVQNRQYTKAGKFAFSLGYGPIVNDTYTDGSQYNLTLNYYMNERMGVELNYSRPTVRENTLVQSFINQNGAVPNYNILKGYYGVSFNWVPFYAKMAVLEQRIIYFDMSFSPGIGMTQYQNQLITNDGATVNALTISLDIAQHFFLDQNFAIRFDVRNRFYNENVKRWRTGEDVQTQRATTTTVLFGVQYYH